MRGLLVIVLALIAWPAWAGDIDVTAAPYHAVGNGVVDNTAALQAAIDAANPGTSMHNLVFPNGSYRITDTLRVGCSAANGHYVTSSFTGQSIYTTAIIYDGPRDRPAVSFCKASAFHWRSLAVQAAPGPRGTSIGILFDGPYASGGTQNTVVSFDECLVSGFNVGMFVGQGDAGSEMQYHQCIFSYNDIGWTASGWNSLNFWFYGVHLLANQVGIKVGGSYGPTDAPHIIGGSSSGNVVADFECGWGFGVLTIENFRAEVQSGATFMTTTNPCGDGLVLRNNTIIGACWCAVPVMEVQASSFITIEDSLIVGQITMQENPVVLTVANTIAYEGMPGFPVIFINGSWGQRVRLTGNTKYGVNAFSGTSAHWFTDKVGRWTGWAFEPGN